MRRVPIILPSTLDSSVHSSKERLRNIIICTKSCNKKNLKVCGLKLRLKPRVYFQYEEDTRECVMFAKNTDFAQRTNKTYHIANTTYYNKCAHTNAMYEYILRGRKSNK